MTKVRVFTLIWSYETYPSAFRILAKGSDLNSDFLIVINVIPVKAIASAPGSTTKAYVHLSVLLIRCVLLIYIFRN